MDASDAVPVINSAHVVSIIRSGGVRVAKQQVKTKKEAAAIRSWQHDLYHIQTFSTAGQVHRKTKGQLSCSSTSTYICCLHVWPEVAQRLERALRVEPRLQEHPYAPLKRRASLISVVESCYSAKRHLPSPAHFIRFRERLTGPASLAVYLYETRVYSVTSPVSVREYGVDICQASIGAYPAPPTYNKRCRATINGTCLLQCLYKTTRYIWAVNSQYWIPLHWSSCFHYTVSS